MNKDFYNKLTVTDTIYSLISLTHYKFFNDPSKPGCFVKYNPKVLWLRFYDKDQLGTLKFFWIIK